MLVHVGENTSEVEADVGDSVVIALPENGTTGYQWSVEPASDALVVESNEYRSPDSGAPGAAGERVVELRATRPGTTVVELRLQRVWETAATERRELAVTVRP